MTNGMSNEKQNTKTENEKRIANDAKAKEKDDSTSTERKTDDRSKK